ncbi:MAG: hypothetical protein MZV70_69315 [Desulfobacterales bacterium]|nr:hypothetical protein [Desulfobacterales bacterium]
MIKTAGPIACLCAALVLAACNSGPSDPGRRQDLRPRTQSRVPRGPRGPARPGGQGVERDRRGRPRPALADRGRLQGREVEVKGSALSHDQAGRLHLAPRGKLPLDGCGSPDRRSRKRGKTGDHYEFTVAARAVGDGDAPPSRGPPPRKRAWSSSN